MDKILFDLLAHLSERSREIYKLFESDWFLEWEIELVWDAIIEFYGVDPHDDRVYDLLSDFQDKKISMSKAIAKIKKLKK